MMRLTVVSQTPEEVVLKVEGQIRLAIEAGVLAREGQRRLKAGQRLVLELRGLQAINHAGLGLLQWWADTGQPVVLRHSSDSLRAVLRFHRLTPEEDPQPLPG
ncbi:MAG: STAS domain-containing protein [Candidatus Latescibacteria bacterium]|nr:STAS domain-containing protein [Candidatus Latescibacterota bacterium]